VHLPIKKHCVHVSGRVHFLELVSQRCFPDEVAQVLPEAILNSYLTAGEGLPNNFHAALI
jgi:hypothetical protein